MHLRFPPLSQFSQTAKLLLLLGLFGLASGPASGQIFVTNLNDTGPGSFRQAVAGAFTGDTIKFNVTGTINLLSGPVSWGNEITIWGPGMQQLEISGVGAHRVFEITAGSTYIKGITVKDGFAGFQWGGAVQFDGTALTLDSVRFANNYVDRGWGSITKVRGGAVSALGTKLHLINAVFEDNYVDLIQSSGGPIEGGAIYAGTDSLISEGSSFYRNHIIHDKTNSSSSTLLSYGGAIFFDGGFMDMRDCLFDSNYVYSRHRPDFGPTGANVINFGGALAAISSAPGTYAIKSCTFTDNFHQTDAMANNNEGAHGGAMYIVKGAGNMTIDSCHFERNILDISPANSGSLSNSGQEGGALLLANLNGGQLSDTLRVMRCTFLENEAPEGGAIRINGSNTQIIEQCLFEMNRGERSGGAVQVYGGTVHIRYNEFNNQTLYSSKPFAGGAGLHVGATTNCEVYGNLFNNNNIDRNPSFPAGTKQGGGIYVSDQILDKIYNNTFVGNRADEGGGLYALRSAFVAHNTFVDDSINQVSGAAGRSVYSDNETVFIKNNIFANTLATTIPYIAVDGPANGIVTSLGGNLARDNTILAFLNQPSDLNGTNPQFQPLANNGGFSRTAALNANSPAINSALPDTLGVFDQRHFLRDASPDRGAFEFGAANPNAVTISTQPLPASACPQKDVFFTVSASGPSLTFAWQLSTDNGATFQPVPNAAPYSGAGSDTLRISSVNPSMDGNLFYCLLNGNTNSDTVILNAFTAPTANAGLDTSICLGDTAVLQGSGGSVYNWDQGLGAGSMHSVSPTVTTTYTLAVTDQNNCNDSDQVVVTVNPSPTVDLGNDTTLCAPNTILLDAGNSGALFNWSNGATTPTILVNATGNYSVTVDAAGCTTTDDINVTLNPQPIVDLGNDTALCVPNTILLDAGNSGALFNWSNGATTPTISINATGNYSVTVDAGGCTATDDINITVNPLPVVSFTGLDTLYCDFDPGVTLVGSPSGGQFSGAGVVGNVFTPSAAGLGVHTLTYTYSDANGCTNSAIQTASVETCVGISPSFLSEVLLYPNPNQGAFTVELPLSALAAQVYFRLTDLRGKVLVEGPVEEWVNGSLGMQVSDLKAGVYLLILETAAGDRVEKRVLVW